jgi:hypothetical protein
MTNRGIEDLLGSPQLPALSQERLKGIETTIAANLKPVRPLAPAGVYLAGFAGIFLVVCAIGCWIVGHHGWTALSMVQKLTVFVPLAASTSLAAFSLVRQMAPAAKHVGSTALISAGLFVLLLVVMTVVFHPAQESAFVRNGLVCFRTGIAFAIPAAFLFALLLLRGASLSPGLTGATAGGLAGLVGLAVLEVHCPNLDLFHILVWHVSVTLVCAIGGFAFSSVTFWRRISNS